MLTGTLINTAIPRLQLQDSVAKALQLLSDYRMTHLPVVAEEKFLGLISEEDLLDATDDQKTIELLQNNFLKTFVKHNVHFLQAVNVFLQSDSNIVPVINEEENFLGVITSYGLLDELGNFAGADELGGLIVVEMERQQFAISEISRIVESNDAHILHLNTTVHPQTGMLTVTLHISKREIASIIASFERYDYRVVYSLGTERFENEIDNNYRQLMHYLNI